VANHAHDSDISTIRGNHCTSFVRLLTDSPLLPPFGSIFNSLSLSLINAATSHPNRTVHIHNQGRTSSRCDKSEHYTSTTTQKKGGGKSRSHKSSQQHSRMHMHRREYLFALRQRTAAGICQTWKLYDRLQGLECP
jgi:hypothetical protein